MAKIPNTGQRSFIVHLPTYENIKRFWGQSASNITASVAVRKLLIRYGEWCGEQLRTGHIPTGADLDKAAALVDEVTARTSLRRYLASLGHERVLAIIDELEMEKANG